MYVKAGEHIFNGYSYRDINRWIYDDLFITRVISGGKKIILEALTDYREYGIKDSLHEESLREEMKANILMNEVNSDILSQCFYHIEIRGKVQGDMYSKSTSNRCEPHRDIFNVSEESTGVDLLEVTSTEQGILPTIEKDVDLSQIFNEDLEDALMSVLSELSTVDIESEEDYKEYEIKRDQAELEFFNRYRNNTSIPEGLRGKRLVIKNLIFSCDDDSSIETIDDLDIVFRERYANYVIEQEIRLDKDTNYPIRIDCAGEYKDYTNKISIEAVEFKENRSEGKEGVYITYQTIDNVLVRPTFLLSDVLNSPSGKYMLNHRLELLDGIGSGEYNHYRSHVGYVENKDIELQIELFSVYVTQVINERFNLIGGK